jgi:prepilin-type processing-associated H-X9-DG protein
MTINDFCGEARLVNCNNNSQPYAFHPGGLNCGFADGSVHYLNELVDHDAFVSLLTLAGRDAVARGAKGLD